MHCYLVILLILIVCLNAVHASNGDYSSYFQSCLYEFVTKNCTENQTLAVFNERQPLHLKLLAWDCVDECKYECMWQTVKWFQKMNYDVPQFYGKWPFVRVYGVQEPVSVVASMLHFVFNFHMLQRTRREISNSAVLKPLWVTFAFLNLIGWFWSTVFHTRDFPFTEKMDYYCAFGLVLFQFNAFFIRYITYHNKIKRKRYYNYLVSALCLLFYAYHVYFLHFVHFDYGYNMKVNIFFGLFNSICWLVCSSYEYKYRRLKYSWRNIFVILLIDVTTVLFEVQDFKPILWLADGHALWHLTTCIVPLFWFQYFIDDSNYHTRIENLTHLD